MQDQITKSKEKSLKKIQDPDYIFKIYKIGDRKYLIQNKEGNCMTNKTTFEICSEYSTQIMEFDLFDKDGNDVKKFIKSSSSGEYLARNAITFKTEFVFASNHLSISAFWVQDFESINNYVWPTQ